MTQPKLIVVWGGEDILSSSIELLLAAKVDWKVVRVVNTVDLDALILAVETIRPDIVIIHKGDSKLQSYLPMQLLLDHPAIKVITISLESNSLDVYSKHRMLVKQASDLIAEIENEP